MDRTGHRSELGAAGADVVEDLGEVTVDTPLHSICDLLDALSRREEIRSRLDGVTLAVFLDYDGTLTPTVERPEDARLPEAVRSTVERLASRRERRDRSGLDLETWWWRCARVPSWHGRSTPRTPDIARLPHRMIRMNQMGGAGRNFAVHLLDPSSP